MSVLVSITSPIASRDVMVKVSVSPDEIGSDAAVRVNDTVAYRPTSWCNLISAHDLPAGQPTMPSRTSSSASGNSSSLAQPG
eukprot:3680899-Rhodomonas_salina.1